MESCPKIEVTSSKPWNPASVNLQRIQPPHYDINECNHCSVNDQYDYCEEMPKCGMTLSEATSIPLINEEKLTRLYDNDLEDMPRVRTYVSTERHNRVSANILSEILGIGPQKAA